jgi:3-isopropylmalate/(R)-2-methylmalate dehydratase small subunit
MIPFAEHTGTAVPLDRAHVDTDAIIPARFLTSISRSGFEAHLFDGWRFLDRAAPGTPADGRPLNPDFVLNLPRHRAATILLARENFGCGSSREHAVWAIQQYGLRVVIAPSFGDIFYQNSLKSGLLPVRLPAAAMDVLFNAVQADSATAITVDLPSQTVAIGDGPCLSFEMDAERKHQLIHGLDDIGLTLAVAEKIRAFQAGHWAQFPWLAARL